MTIGLKNSLFNRGMLFMHLPEMMLFQSKQNRTESSYLFKISKLVGNKPDRKQNDHSLGKIREGDFSEKYFKKLFGKDIFEKFNKQIEQIGIDPKTVGGWIFLQSNLHNLEAINKEQKQFIDYLIKLCEIDKSYIDFTTQINPENKQDIEDINKSIRQWLLLPNLDFSNTDIETGADLIIALLLHWTALFEHFLRIEYRQDKNTPSFINYLPKISKKGKLEFTNEIFLTRFKDLWASKNYSQCSITWTTLYRDIECTKNKNRPDFETFRINPNTDRIKKTLTRWRNGKESFLTIEAIKKELLVLYQPYNPNDYDFTLYVIVFAQLFDSIQRELQIEGLSDEYILEQFARYPLYLDLVEMRFDKFKEKGIVKP